MVAVKSPLLATPVTDPAFPRSQYHLTADQVRFFDENGYLILRNWIPADLVMRLKEAGDGWIQQGMAQESKDTQNWDEDYAFREMDGKRVMYRVNYLHNKGYPASLELLGAPQTLAVAESLCGVNCVPTYESMVFKQDGDGAAIRWHQDAIHPRRWRIFNFDVYLDASRKGAGALFVIPGTQKEKQPFCNIEDTHGWEVPEAIEVEMAPGDVLLHDVMVAHGSPETHGNALRRTLYYEFRAAEEILAEGPWDQDWIERRMRLLPVAMRRYQQAFLDGEQFSWKASPQFRPQVSTDEEVELKVAHVWHTPSAFCSAGDAGKK